MSPTVIEARIGPARPSKPSETRECPAEGALLHERSVVRASSSRIDTCELARRIRIHSLRMTSVGGSSHIGSIFSCADVLAVLYGGVLNVNPATPKDPGRDRFVLSKGHAGAGLYAALAERGFFPVE